MYASLQGLMDIINTEKTCGKLIRNIYGVKSGAFYFLEEVFQLLHNNGFKSSEADQCLMHKTPNDGTYTVVALSSDDHITASNQRNLDRYYTLLSERYDTKRLGKPTKYLGCYFTYSQNGTISISQPLLVAKLIDAMQISKDTPSPTPYLANHGLHPPLPD